VNGAAQAWRCYDFRGQGLPADFFRSSCFFSPRCLGKDGASTMRRLILLLSVGWLPPSLPPSGACLSLGSRVLAEPLNAAEGYTKPGLRLFRCTLAPLRVARFSGSWLIPSRRRFRRPVGPPGQWPPESRSTHGRWRRCPHGHVCLVIPGVGSVYRASPGLSTGCPGSRWAVFRVAVAEDDCLWQDNEKPPPLRPGGVAPACYPLWEWNPGGGAPRRQVPREGAPETSSVPVGSQSVSGPPCPPRG